MSTQRIKKRKTLSNFLLTRNEALLKKKVDQSGSKKSSSSPSLSTPSLSSQPSCEAEATSADKRGMGGRQTRSTTNQQISNLVSLEQTTTKTDNCRNRPLPQPRQLPTSTLPTTHSNRQIEKITTQASQTQLKTEKPQPDPEFSPPPPDPEFTPPQPNPEFSPPQPDPEFSPPKPPKPPPRIKLPPKSETPDSTTPVADDISANTSNKLTCVLSQDCKTLISGPNQEPNHIDVNDRQLRPRERRGSTTDCALKKPSRCCPCRPSNRTDCTTRSCSCSTQGKACTNCKNEEACHNKFNSKIPEPTPQNAHPHL
jgi:hypothetical protein